MSEVRARYSAYELRELELAETECPWGEAAETLRTVYLADRVLDAIWGNEDARNEAQRILNKLLGPPPKRKKRNR